MASHGSNAATKALLIKVDPSGKGDYRKIQDAIDAVPSNNKQVVLISVKPGIYEEKIIVPANKPFITISGSNPNDTVITWNDSGNIFESPTFSVLASDFVAQYLTIQNTYGVGAKAVALRVSGDRVAFFGCRILSYQDTLLDDTGRHYYSNCYIEGAVDFIYASITAQHRDSPSQNTGFTFLGCKITGIKTALLGRAWGPYSRVIFAFTYMSNVILPQGWDDCGDSSKQREYKCYGPGASTKKRVEWAKELTIEEANPFLTKNMIGGKSWITSTTYRFTKLSSNAISRNNTRHHA
ncbi:hypothetical protein E1A91_D07G133400v1 [Gossypium mustelinum]|uniref:pectinesterase n=1 Tax=Gossypium mustelinum TaxID=34275 RepID=A0A5D2UB21_GOSMU|nr:hypothetical protein E1A91_D07G133400v1 [Gossypium mustelinum]